MRKRNQLLYVLGVSLWCFSAFAVEELDRLYSFQNITAVVVNTRDEPVHGEHVESELVQLLSKQMRFNWHVQGYTYLKEQLQKSEIGSLGKLGLETTDKYQILFPDLVKMEVNALILTEVRPTQRGKYEISLILLIPETGEIIQSALIPVEDHLVLNSFTTATQKGLKKLLKSIPFDASIIDREGYRVVIDGGYPKLRVGMRLSTYTMERRMGEIVFTESGTILLTRVDRNLSFGKIMVEKKPHEISVGHKFRIHRPQTYVTRMNIGYPGKKRELSSLETLPSVQKGNLGNMSISLGASLVSHSLTSVGAASSVSKNALYPGGNLRSELWLTKRVFFDVGFHFSNASLGTTGGGQDESLNSTLSSFHGQLGYRLNFTGQPLGPTIFAKVGLATHRFVIDQAVDPLFFGNATYKGISFGAGADIPFHEEFGFGVEINTLVFPSLDEGPQTSGAETTHVSGYDFMIYTYHNLSSDLDLELGLVFANFSSQFSGTGTRTTSLASASRSSKALFLGISHYF